MKKILGIDVDGIAHRCAEQIAKHDHRMSSPEIEETLREISGQLERIATLLESRKPPP